MRADHLNGAHEAGIPALGGFFWIDPLVSAQANCDKALEAAQGLPVTYLCPDVEQWWANWEAWRLWRAGQGPIPVHFDPIKLATHTKQVMVYLKANDPRPIKLYTRRGFIMDYMPSLTSSPEFSTWDLYLASYTNIPNIIRTTWEQLRSMYLPGSTWSPVVPPNGKPCKMCQWSGDKIIVPGYKGVIDMDFFDGSDVEFSTFFGLAPVAPSLPTPVEPTDTEKLSILWTWFKETHA